METSERVRENTSDQTNSKIDAEIQESIRYYSRYKKQIPARIEELEKEWDIERAIEFNAAVLALSGTVLGVTVNKRFLVLPLIVTAFLTQHAIQGWCPPVPVFRALGFRTRQEIDKEKYALKALMGHFDVPKRSEEVWQAVSS